MSDAQPEPTTQPDGRTPDANSGPIEVVGDYELLGELAHGGMGVVYRARQRSLNRTVALKMILSARLSPAALARFQAEAQATAELDHPNIVPIYEVGACGGQPFFSMKFIDGGTLSALLRKNPRPTEKELVAILVKVCRAIHFAHQRGILHRDLKPGNVLLDAGGEPFVADFGLVKRLGIDDGMTVTGTPLGTPAYMAPEQAEGSSAAVTTLADVYALGAILYEMLTGRPPFRGETLLDVLRQVRDAQPDPPSRANPGVDPNLVAVCLKCLEKDPARRYASSGELADDLDRWRNGEPVQARPAGAAGRVVQWVRRNARAAVWVVLIGTAWGLFGPQMPMALRIYTPLAARLDEDGHFPSATVPWVLRAAWFAPDWLYLWVGVPVATLLHLSAGMLTYLATRSRDPYSHLGGGAAVGLIGGMIAYTLYLGPAFVLVLSYVPNKNDQALLGTGYATRDAPAGEPHPQERLLRDHPELADRPERDRGRLVARQATARVIGGTFEGIALGMFVTLATALPLSVGGAALAGFAVRRCGSVAAALTLYLELFCLLSLVLTGLVIPAVYLFLGWDSRVVALLLGMVGALGLGFVALAALGRWRWQDRWRMYGAVFGLVGVPYLLIYGGPTHSLFALLAFVPALVLAGYSWIRGRRIVTPGAADAAPADLATTRPISPAGITLPNPPEE